MKIINIKKSFKSLNGINHKVLSDSLNSKINMWFRCHQHFSHKLNIKRSSILMDNIAKNRVFFLYKKYGETDVSKMNVIVKDSKI